MAENNVVRQRSLWKLGVDRYVNRPAFQETVLFESGRHGHRCPGLPVQQAFTFSADKLLLGHRVASNQAGYAVGDMLITNSVWMVVSFEEH